VHGDRGIAPQGGRPAGSREDDVAGAGRGAGPGRNRRARGGAGNNRGGSRPLSCVSRLKARCRGLGRSGRRCRRECRHRAPGRACGDRRAQCRRAGIADDRALAGLGRGVPAVPGPGEPARAVKVGICRTDYAQYGYIK